MIDTDSALAKTKESLGLNYKDNVRRLPVRTMLRIAASILLASTIGIAIYLNQTAIDWTTIAATDSIKEYKLPDGSVVTLNKGANLSYAQNVTDQRLLKLEGEAFFDVVRDENRPFIITSGNAQVKVLGTSFNVSSFEDQVEVSVRTGRVLLADKDNEKNGVILEKDQAAYLSNLTQEITSVELDRNYLAWKTGIFTFSNTPVKEALQSLANYHIVNLNFDDNVSDKCSITSTFNRSNWKDIVQEFSLLYALEFIEKADTIVVKGGKSCE